MTKLKFYLTTAFMIAALLSGRDVYAAEHQDPRDRSGEDMSGEASSDASGEGSYEEASPGAGVTMPQDKASLKGDYKSGKQGNKETYES